MKLKPHVFLYNDKYEFTGTVCGHVYWDYAIHDVCLWFFSLKRKEEIFHFPNSGYFNILHW